MYLMYRRTLAATLTIAALAVSATAAQAQPFQQRPASGSGFSGGGGVGQQRFPTAGDPRPVVISGRPFASAQDLNPNFNPYIGPGVTLKQWAATQTTINQVNSQLQPWQLGYNPYPQMVNNGPMYRYPPSGYPSPYGPGPYGPSP